MSTRNGYKFYWLAVPPQRRAYATFIPVPLYRSYNELTILGIIRSTIQKDYEIIAYKKDQFIINWSFFNDYKCMTLLIGIDYK